MDGETNDRSRSERIQAIVSESIRGLRDGVDFDSVRVEQRYPELMPELGEQLSGLREIGAAAQAVSKTPARRDDAVVELLRSELNSYDILERICGGGQGVVVRAMQKASQRIVALKVMLDGPLATERQRHRFEREIELISRLEHPNIVTLYESGVVGNRPYYAMQHVEGMPIDEYVDAFEFGSDDCIRLFVKVVRALAYAHRNGVIHRDLTPANILVDLDGEPHVLDFGLAADDSADDARRLSQDGMLIGTPAYCSPEQARGLTTRLDVRSDVYSLGVILFEVLARTSPYQIEADGRGVREVIIAGETIPLRKAMDAVQHDPKRSVGYDVEAVLAKAMRMDPDARYQSADALADDLERYLTGEAVEACADNRAYVIRKLLRRYRVPVAVAGAFVALLVGALIGMTVLWQRAERVATIAQTGLQMAGMLKVGGYARDQGRFEDAVRLFQKVLEIGKSTPGQNRDILRFRFYAHQMLAHLYYDHKDNDNGDRSSDAAFRLAEKLGDEIADDAELARMYAFAQMIRGRSFAEQRHWREARMHFMIAEQNRTRLMEPTPDDRRIVAELAGARYWLGICCRNLKSFDEARKYYTSSYELTKANHAAAPEVFDFSVDLSRSEFGLASWHFAQETMAGDEAARELLERAESRLASILHAKQPGERIWDAERLLEQIRANLAAVENKIADRI